MKDLIPSSVCMAREAIKLHPKLFLNSYETEVVLSRLMRDYKDKCLQYVSHEEPIITEIKYTLQSLTQSTNP